MGYAQFLNMIPEVALTAILIVVFIADFCSTGHKNRRWFNPLVAVMLAGLVVINLCTLHSVSLFGGMYEATPAAGVMKSILALGTLIVVIQAGNWLHRTDTEMKEGEFYELIVSTLLGMYVMMSSGHFLMFFLGLEMASVPLSCLVAFDSYRKLSAEAAAKFILTAVFSSAVMLYGISFIYGSVGTLYFCDVAHGLIEWAGDNAWLNIMGLVFFFSGLGFKISLVPFHFWTADTYQGAPTTVTGYLSVVSKGAASFTLLTILYKAFGPMVETWTPLLYIVIVLSITIANLFAIRQSELKRFMAFSSISQAGYIMLAVCGGGTMSVASLSFYVLVYVVANMSVFSIIAAVENANNGTTDIATYNGFYQTNPHLSLLMTLALFSLAGIPPFAGMFSKFFVFMAACQSGSVWAYAVVFIALINTVVSLYYYLLIVKAMYINKSEQPLPTFRTDCGTRTALAICTAGILLFGVCSCIYDFIFAAGA